MTEISQHAYNKIREFIQTNFDHISLTHDGTGDGVVGEVLRLNPSDERVQWNSALTDQEQELQIEVSGNDEDINFPQSFTGCSVYWDAEDNEPLAEKTFSPRIIESETDSFTVQVVFKVPVQIEGE